MKLNYTSALFYGIVLCCLPFWCLAQTTPNYCLNKGTRTNVWINKISIGNWSHQSGNNNGYLQKSATELVLKSVTSYPLQLELGGVPRIQDTMYWQIWVDANGDGDFEDAQEMVFQAKSLQRTQPKGDILLPYDAKSGLQRLRLVLSKTGFVGSCEQSAKVLEVEDYDFSLEEGQAVCTALAPQNIHIEIITDSSARIFIKRPASLAYHLDVRDEYGTVVYHTEYLLGDTVLIRGLEIRTTYHAKVQLQCYPDVFSPWSEAAVFTTPTPICNIPKLENMGINSLNAGRYAFATDLSASFYNWRFRLKGELEWIATGSTNDTLVLPLDFDDQELEIQLSITCKNVVQSEWSLSKTFRTAEACAEPKFENISVKRDFFFKKTNLIYSNHSDLRHWRLRVLGDSSWMEFTEYQAALSLDTLFSESFEVQLRLECRNGQLSAWSKSIVLAASNCPQLNPNAARHFEYFFGPYPSLQIIWKSSAPSAKAEATYKWSFREKGQEEWSTPQQSNAPETVLHGMMPGRTYEIRMEVTCAVDSLKSFSVIETKFLPPSCVEIDKSRITIHQHHKVVSVDVEIEYSLPIQVRYAQKGSTEYDTLFALGGWGPTLKNLLPNTEYEVSVRGYCYGSTELPWSDPLYFKSLSCELPLLGAINLQEFAPTDSIGFTASFFTPRSLDTTLLIYHWQYRVRDSSTWTRTALSKANFPQFTLRNIQLNTNYELQLVAHCISNPIDSFALSTYFSTDPMQCGSKPDTTILRINKYPWLGASHSQVTSKLPDTYLWEVSVLQREGNEWTILSNEVYQRIPPNYQLNVDDDKAFQFRIICPNKTVSPWSEIIFPGGFAKFEEPISLFKGFVLKEKLIVAPNPSNGQFNILLPAEIPTGQSEGWLEVFNVAGQKVLGRKTSVNAGDASGLDLSDQSPGMYLLRLKIGQQVFTERLLLNKGQ